MKKTQFQQLRTRSAADLRAEVAKLKKEWFNASSDLTLKKSKNVHQKRVIRRDIAQILTVINEKRDEAQEEKK